MQQNSKSKLFERLYSLSIILFGWLILFPISLLFSKKNGLFVSINRTGNSFVDNTKYFHLFLLKNHDASKVFYLSDTKNISENIPNLVKHPSLKSIMLLLRAEYIIIDYSLWFYKFKYHLSIKAKKIQLWHGVSSKKIELATNTYTESRYRNLLTLYGRLRGQLCRYFLISSTSTYYTDNLYNGAFFYENIKEFGQARNDVLFREPDDYDLEGTDQTLMKHLLIRKNQNGSKIILYTPTYRANLSIDLLNIAALNSFAIVNNLVFVIKHHILTDTKYFSGMENVILYDKRKDIYPLMSISDAMITDYSSIYVDYLLLNKPVLFYIPDFEGYKKSDTPLRNDFLDISPGVKCYNQDDLHNSLLDQIVNLEDKYAKQRKEVLDFSYDFVDGNASKRIYEFLLNKQ